MNDNYKPNTEIITIKILEMMWKESAMICFRVLFQNFPLENNESPQPL
jgi:hypothetical protein